MVSAGVVGEVKGYTVLLWVFGFFLVVAAVMMHSMSAQEEESAWVFRMVRNMELVMAAACFLVATLRSIGSRIAGTATTAISIILATYFPFGTAAFIWWLVSVRKREESGVAEAHPRAAR